MKLNIKNVDSKKFSTKASSQQLLQAGSCGGGGSEGRTKVSVKEPLIAPHKG